MDARIHAAGNAAEESQRLALLRGLAADPSLDKSLRDDLATLIGVSDSWANGRQHALEELSGDRRETHNYLHRFFANKTEPFAPPFPAPPAVESPLYPLWAFYRARFLTWFMIEDSGVSGVPERKKLFLEQSEAYFDLARRTFPENPTLKIYGGENLLASNLSKPDDRAPAWANEQRRALEQLHRIIRWWIAERQLPNGEFGGKWGDDIEMWRWWSSVLVGFDDPFVRAGEELLARGNLHRPSMALGYTNHLTDVEHTAEETGDTLTPLQHIAPDDPEWSQRSRQLLTLADQLWWGKNDRGQLQFKHIDFSSTQLGADAGRAYDTGYHTRVLQPLLLLWQRTGDRELGARLLPWLRTWAEAANGTENGKPAGIVPSALQWPSGRPGSAEQAWVGPHLEGDAMVGLYSWPSFPAVAMTQTLLLAHVQTGEALFFDPLVRMANLRRQFLKTNDPDDTPRSEGWVARRIPLVLYGALAKWRQYSGDTQFDDLLRTDSRGYERFMLDGDHDRLAKELGESARTLSYNWPMFTSEVRYTDRVLTFPHAWRRTVATGLQRVDAYLLYSTVTGDPGTILHFPLNGARWHTLPTEIAVLVTQNKRDHFAAELFHFGDSERSLAVSLFVLDAGIYTWRVISAEGTVLSKGRSEISPAQRRLSFSLPSRVLCTLEVTKTGGGRSSN